VTDQALDRAAAAGAPASCYRYLNHVPLSTFNTYQVAESSRRSEDAKTEAKESASRAAVAEVKWGV